MWQGGDGVIRDIEFRIPVQVSILSERRVYHPYGLAGGEEAQCGMNIWVRKIERSNPGRSDKRIHGVGEGDDEVVLEERRINLGGVNTFSLLCLLDTVADITILEEYSGHESWREDHCMHTRRRRLG